MTQDPTDQLDFSLMRFLLTLNETQSMRKTANVLGLSQSKASRQLTRAAELFGDKLFIRSGYRMLPTVEMQRMEPVLKRLLSSKEDLFSAPTVFEPRSLRRSFKLGLPDHGILAILSPALAAIMRVAPDVRIDVIDCKTMTWDLLRTGDLDMISYPRSDIPGDFESLELYRCGYSLLVRKGHPLEKVLKEKKRLLPEDVMRYPRIGIPATKHLENSEYLNPPFVALTGQHTSVALPYHLAAPLLLADNDCTLWLPTVSAEAFAKVFPIVLLPTDDWDEKFEFTARLVWHKSKSGDVAHQWLRSMIAQNVRADARDKTYDV